MDAITITEAAAITGFPAKTIRNWCQSGRLRSRKVGERLRLIDPADLEGLDRPPHISQIRKEAAQKRKKSEKTSARKPRKTKEKTGIS